MNENTTLKRPMQILPKSSEGKGGKSPLVDLKKNTSNY